MTIAEKYKKEHNIDEILNTLLDFDSYSEYQELLREMVNYIKLLEELLGES